VSDELALLPGYLAAHLELTLVALGVGTALSVPAGILITRRRAFEAPLLGLASVIQTIPSLALLAMMVPALALASAWLEPRLGISLPAIGALPALVALTLYATLPILRNTVVGIAGVDPAVIEAARGVGMSGREQLLRVELPLALPSVHVQSLQPRAELAQGPVSRAEVLEPDQVVGARVAVEEPRLCGCRE